jgi:superfamily II DNA or RNA helicase
MALVLRQDRGTLILEDEAAGGGLPDAAPEAQPDWPTVRARLEALLTPDPRISGRLRAKAMAYRAIVEVLHRGRVPFTDAARAYETLTLAPQRPREPYPHQQEALDAWLRAGRRGVVVLPTGAGKSWVAVLAMAAVGRATLVVAPTLDLVGQWAAMLKAELGLDAVGVVGGGSFELKPITVTTYDSAHLRVEALCGRFGLVVYDECHHLPGPTYQHSAEGLIAPFRLGLTATPERTDGGEERLWSLIGPLVHRVEMQALRGLYLAAWETVRLHAMLAPDEVAAYERARATYRAFIGRHRIAMGSPTGWSQFIALSARSREGRAAFAAWREQRRLALGCRMKFALLESLLLQHRDEQLLIFANDIDTVEHIARTWLIPSLTSETPGPERRATLAAFAEGRLGAIVTARVLNEGVDLPNARVGVVLSGTATVREHVQRLGRLLRKSGDKEAILYEIVTAGTSEELASERRRDHGAWRGEGPDGAG